MSVLVFILGACLGSFLNVVVYRLPRGRSLISPGSRCPHCGRAIRPYDNIPILSYLFLRGKCRACSQPISARYPAVEAATALLALALWQRWESQPAWFALVLVACAALLAVALIDWDTFLIPDELSLGLLGLGLLVSPCNPLLDDSGLGQAVFSSVLGAAAGFFICWATAEIGERLLKKEAMGGGDVKLLAAVGAWSGALGAFNCLMLASVLGSAYGLTLMARGRLKKMEPIPFGPFLAMGAVFNFFYLLPLGFPFV